MLINLRTPEYYSNLNEALSTIDNYSSIMNFNRNDILWNEIHEFRIDYNEYHQYFEYINESLQFHLSHQLFDRDKIKELITLKERLIKILNPKIQLVIYREPRENDRLYAYAIVRYLDENLQENLEEIDVVEFIPDNYEYFTERGYYYNIKFKVFEFLKTTLVVPKDIDFEKKSLEIRHYEYVEKITNHCLTLLKKSIDDLKIEDGIELNSELSKKINTVKISSERLFKRLSKKSLLNLTNIRP